ncbi:MAG TPA: hypothetical protein VHX62_16150 [Solirubrobacteraceae bacterium]|jgi:hypothetical protein|nr:hypothetical protein [Solirubrobacteraceae bacterium]
MFKTTKPILTALAVIAAVVAANVAPASARPFDLNARGTIVLVTPPSGQATTYSTIASSRAARVAPCIPIPRGVCLASASVRPRGASVHSARPAAPSSPQGLQWDDAAIVGGGMLVLLAGGAAVAVAGRRRQNRAAAS